MTHEESVQRVQAGVAFLAGVYPGWRAEIDLARLDQSDPGWCVLGQLYEDYSQGVEQLDLSEDRSLAYGFYVTPQYGTYGMQETKENYAVLTAAWIHVLEGK